MIHPLLTNLDTLSEEQIVKNIDKLSNAYYSTKNPYLIDQILLVIDDLKEALAQKRKKLESNLEKNHEHEVDNLININ